MSLNREAILGHVDKRIGTVDVPELGGAIRLANFTVAESEKIRKHDEESGIPFVVKIVILGACDDKGARLFTDEDADALATLPAAHIGKISNAILEHNGLTSSARDDAKNDSSGTEDEGSASD